MLLNYNFLTSTTVPLPPVTVETAEQIAEYTFGLIAGAAEVAGFAATSSGKNLFTKRMITLPIPTTKSKTVNTVTMPTIIKNTASPISFLTNRSFQKNLRKFKNNILLRKFFRMKKHIYKQMHSLFNFVDISKTVDLLLPPISPLPLSQNPQIEDVV